MIQDTNPAKKILSVELKQLQVCLFLIITGNSRINFTTAHKEINLLQHSCISLPTVIVPVIAYTHV